jgi:hypothetical protein
VHTEVFTASAVSFVAERGEADEPGVFAGGCRDEDVDVSATPIERQS